MISKYCICRIAVAPLRSEPSDRSEILSQILFGEKAIVLEKSEKWWRIQNAYDSYDGWVDPKQFLSVDEELYFSLSSGQCLVPAIENPTITAADNSIYRLSAGSEILQHENGYCKIGNEIFKLNFEPLIVQEVDFEKEVEKLALYFLNTPYLWGGKNSFGIDCSGFTQVVFKLLGVKLKRDASQQIEQGILVDFFMNAKLGDLAFFDNEEGKIIHVGIMLGKDKIIHASGKVRIDSIDNQGIYNAELAKYTHNLRLIKRFTEN